MNKQNTALPLRLLENPEKRQEEIRALDIVDQAKEDCEERGFVKKADRLSALRRLLIDDGVNPLLTKKEAVELKTLINEHLNKNLRDYAQVALFIALLQKSQK